MILINVATAEENSLNMNQLENTTRNRLPIIVVGCNFIQQKSKSMKKTLLLLVFVASSFLSSTAQSYNYSNNYNFVKGAYHTDMEFVAHGGLIYSDLRYGSATAFNLGIDFTPFESGDDLFSLSFITNFAKSKDYWSINPLGASAIVLTLFCKK